MTINDLHFILFKYLENSKIGSFIRKGFIYLIDNKI
jgi:hypothetical protein